MSDNHRHDHKPALFICHISLQCISFFFSGTSVLILLLLLLLFSCGRKAWFVNSKWRHKALWLLVQCLIKWLKSCVNTLLWHLKLRSLSGQRGQWGQGSPRGYDADKLPFWQTAGRDAAGARHTHTHTHTHSHNPTAVSHPDTHVWWHIYDHRLLGEEYVLHWNNQASWEYGFFRLNVLCGFHISPKV